MAVTWWQRLRQANPKSGIGQASGRNSDYRFRISDSRPGGWWLRAESEPVRVGLIAAAKPVPALLRAWTFHTPRSYEPPLPRGGARLALLCQWALTG